METFNQDPKPGRLVLPLVLIGMIATTYTFVIVINPGPKKTEEKPSILYKSSETADSESSDIIFFAFGFGVSINSIITIYFNIKNINI